jgi:hypothetical protein
MAWPGQQGPKSLSVRPGGRRPPLGNYRPRHESPQLRQRLTTVLTRSPAWVSWPLLRGP